MAEISPFQPYRYSESAGRLDDLVTQPYDKITPAMQARYLSLNPHNLVRLILGERFPSDTEDQNVYTRAASHLQDWTSRGILVQEAEPSLFAYFQEFRVPDAEETLVRKGFIGLGAVDDYSAGVVHRHEQTLSGPKKDRLELLRHTKAHFGQIFMVYPDPAEEVDRLLDEAAQAQPTATITDEYETVHRIWKISDRERIEAIQQLMSDKKLLIADGHHRYETALAFRNENPDLKDARRVMMTFVNMHSPGLRILATHRLVNGLDSFDDREFLHRAGEFFRVTSMDSLNALQKEWERSAPERSLIGAALASGLYQLEAKEPAGSLDIAVLHQVLLGRVLRVGEDAVRDERHLRYIRGLEPAVEQVRKGAAQIAFLLKPVSIEQVARISFDGGVMPQKSTDFYPKLLSGLTVYKLER